ncbi:MAG TPA: alpha/beta fold hydrolase, partial [Arenicellales bacterium]|nr:alpha/beta fold hydrolase [Arenicellales bacterium]
MIGGLSGGSNSQQGPDIPFAIDPETPPGRLIDIGTHRLHIHCMGTGSPTVIMEYGLGGHSLEWVLVQPELARRQRACAYDRAGYGWSDRGPSPRLSSIIAHELSRLLDRARLEPPFILVGHSFGGFNIRQLQQLRTRDVAGMVLIDSSHEAQFEQFKSQAGVNVTPSGKTFTLKYAPRERNLPPAVRSVVREAQLTRKTYATVRDEMAVMLQSAEEMRTI